MRNISQYKGAVYILQDNAKDKNLILERAFVGVAVRKRIAALFFSAKFGLKLQKQARAPPHSDLISKKSDRR